MIQLFSYGTNTKNYQRKSERNKVRTFLYIASLIGTRKMKNKIKFNKVKYLSLKSTPKKLFLKVTQ